jgi:transcriptional regulator with XRE-family HTH domain
MPIMKSSETFGGLLKSWRNRRGISQLDLACAASLSARHLSFLETGRSKPSRQMALNLAEHLGLPLRERNRWLAAAGFAPVYPEKALTEPGRQMAQDALGLVLRAHEPWPALAVDRHWMLLQANRAVAPLLEGVAPELLAPPVNVLRLSLHPAGLAPRIWNYAEWRTHVLTRLRLEVSASGDPDLDRLHNELAALPTQLRGSSSRRGPDLGGLAASLVLDTAQGRLTLFTTTTVFGTATDVTLDEVTLESFFPADAESGERLRALYQASTAVEAAATRSGNLGGQDDPNAVEARAKASPAAEASKGKRLVP